MKNKDKSKQKPREIRMGKNRVITVKPDAITYMKDLPPEERTKQLVREPNGRTHFAKGVKIGMRGLSANHSSVISTRKVRSVLDHELEKFLMEEVLIPKCGNKKYSTTRMQMFLKAVFIQACKGVGKGRMAELIFERVGGKPLQEIYSDQLTAAVYDDPELRRNRIKELK